MSTLFNVSLETICLRVVNELSLWNGLFISCLWHSNSSDINEKLDYTETKNNYAWRVNWRVIPSTTQGLFIPNPKKNKLSFPKLRWPQIEAILDNISTTQIKKISLIGNDFGKIGNLHKYISSQFANTPLTLSLMKINEVPMEIWPLEMSDYRIPQKPIRKAYIAINLNPNA
jgi:hypothetical protein